MPDKTPVPYESDSDEAPEEVTKESAQQQVQLQRVQEKQARKTQPKSRKRKTKEKNEVAELPEDILTAVAARNEEEEAAEEQEEEKQEKKRREAKKAKLLAKKTHTRQFGNIEVKTLDALEEEKTRELSDSAKAFLERRGAPSRQRMDVLAGHATLFSKKQKQRAKRA